MRVWVRDLVFPFPFHGICPTLQIAKIFTATLMGKKELIAARQHPMHTQGTGIWHLSCSKASVDPAGEHHNLHLRPRASHRSCWQGFNSLCLCSACYWFLLGSKGVRRACSSPKGAGGIVNDTLCQNWLSRNDHHPVGYRCCTGNLEDMGVPKWLVSKEIWGAGLWLRAVVIPSEGTQLLSTLCLGEFAKFLFIIGQT